MVVTKSQVEDLFTVGETIFSGGKLSKYKLTAILDHAVRIQPLKGKTPGSLSYKKIIVLLNHFSAIQPGRIESSVGQLLRKNGISDTKNETYLYGFAREFLKRSINGLEMLSNVVLESSEKAPTKTFPEGQRILVSHVIRERNSKIIPLAKKEFRKLRGYLYCEICDFNSRNERQYGDSIIEGHHITPLGESNVSTLNTIDDIAMLCPNCHTMTHRHIVLYPKATFTKHYLQSLKSIFEK